MAGDRAGDPPDPLPQSVPCGPDELRAECDALTSASTSAERARLAAWAAWSKQGADIAVVEVGEVLAIVDWFVITSASNPRQARTIAEEVEEQLRRHDRSAPLRVEGAADARWILLDYGDIAVHVFLEEARSYYDLERLWADVGRLDWREGLPDTGARAGATFAEP